MTFLHCGDIHLDSSMERNLTAAQARERNAEVCATFARMAAYAAERDVTAVIIAGDLFDARHVAARITGFVLDTIRATPGVDFLYLRGNHDLFGFEGMDLPENLKTFGPEWTYYSYENVTVAGMNLEREKWEACYEELALPEETVNIVTLHGQISVQPGEELIALPKLRNKNIDYLALGHIHSYRTGALDERGAWCYCGCLEGRGFDELGPKGFVLLHVEGNRVKQEFVPFARRMLEEVQVDISGLTSGSRILAAAQDALRETNIENLVRLTLIGSYTPETRKDLNFLQKMLEGRFYLLKIRDESRLKFEKETYEHDISLKGEFIRLVMASDRSDEEKERIICYGIRALSGEEVE